MNKPLIYVFTFNGATFMKCQHCSNYLGAKPGPPMSLTPTVWYDIPMNADGTPCHENMSIIDPDLLSEEEQKMLIREQFQYLLTIEHLAERYAK